MPFNVPHCTITSYSSIEYGEDNVSDGTINNPITLVITSNDVVLFPITPADFRVVGAIETNFGNITYTTIQNRPEVESVEFVQSGNEVNVIVTLVNSFNMNDLNQLINFCIEGTPAISSTVTGNIFNIITNQITI